MVFAKSLTDICPDGESGAYVFERFSHELTYVCRTMALAGDIFGVLFAVPAIASAAKTESILCVFV